MIQTLNVSKKESPVIKQVYYFSGTGNSYYVAKRIAADIGAVLKPIVSLQKGDVIDVDVLCFVFPIYEFKPPKIVTQIIKNLSTVNAKYSIAVATYGVSLFTSLRKFKKTLKQKGVVLSCGYGIKSPHNAMGSISFTDKKNDTRLEKADQKILKIISNIQARSTSKVERTSIFEDMTIILQLKHIIKLLYILIFKGSSSLSFTVTDECIGCQLCTRICPVNNIDWTDEKPVFGITCVSCFACLQWCPKSAIQLGKYSLEQMSIKHYNHPQVTAEDLVSNSRFIDE
ncbi:MAG: 4Fe-4S binding protein [Acholeplasmataceae bacterium]|nr:4Fe-4S binding protein [Acholeplasmataceae bacterium]